jgi:putative ABC transport system permease protein
MIRNYIKVALRSIFRNKLTAFINIAGLALAMTCAILIFLYITDELSYDKYHSKSERIYRVNRIFHTNEGQVNLSLANVAPPIGPLLKNDYGQIEILARTVNYRLVIGLEENGELKMVNSEDEVFVVEPDLFKIFDIEVMTGNQSTSLERPFTVMLSEKTALRYFNSTNIIGKRLRANNAFDLEVTGVYKDFPSQSHWHPQFMVSFSTLNDNNIYGREGLETNWGNNSFGTYMVLEEGADAKKLEAMLPDFIDKHFGTFVRERFNPPADFKASKGTTLKIQKVADVHLYSHMDDELETNGNITNIYMMGVIGVFIILIACFNFINLSTARATKRAKEAGLRKVVGAFRNQLVGQYLSESILISFLSLILGLILTYGTLGWLNDFTSKAISLNPIQNPELFVGLALFAVVIGVLAGIYPAFVISSFKPALTLKGQHGSATGKAFIRKGLVVAQFAISIVLIIATLITFQQLDFLNGRDLGYAKDQVITLPYYSEVAQSYDAFYNELTKSAYIKNIGRSSRVPTGRLLDSYGGASFMKGDSLVPVTVNLRSISVDEDFFNTYEIGLAAGRMFSKDIPTDDSLAFIINEAAVKGIGWKNAAEHIGEQMTYAGVNGKLIGVVKDFHFESLHQQISPMIFLQRSGNYNTLSLKISSKDMNLALLELEKKWKEFVPSRPYNYTFVSERYKALYESEQKQSKLFTTFSILAIFIASLGLFGLATFNTMQRVKEIGIRKVLGASVMNIVQLLSREIILLVIIANVIAWPVAWYFMNEWLNSFAYRIDINVALYLIAAFAAIMIALLTVSSQTIGAAMRNPANTLRYE